MHQFSVVRPTSIHHFYHLFTNPSDKDNLRHQFLEYKLSPTILKATFNDVNLMEFSNAHLIRLFSFFFQPISGYLPR